MCNQGKKYIFRPIDKEEREMFQNVTNGLTGVGYDPLAVKLWPINGGNNSVMYIFLCATYRPFTSGKPVNNLALVYISESTLGEHKFTLENIEPIAEKHEDAAMYVSNDSSFAGAWNIKAQVLEKGELPDSLKTGFPEVFKEFVGPHYEAVIYAAIQTVNGTNHMLICEGTYPRVEKLVSKIVLHETIPDNNEKQGHFSLLSIEPIVIDCDDGWKVQPSRWTGYELPSQLMNGFKEAMKGHMGTEVNPLMFCGTQSVSGTNYMIICKTTPIVPDAKAHIDKIILHQEKQSGDTPGQFFVISYERIV